MNFPILVTLRRPRRRYRNSSKLRYRQFSLNVRGDGEISFYDLGHAGWGD